MKLETITTLEKPISIVVPPLPREAREKLPSYCPRPIERNLATQYYFWNLELQKENRGLRKEKEKLERKKEELERENRSLKERIKELLLEKEKFLRIIFKTKREKKRGSIIKELPKKPRSKESYCRPFPNKIDEEKEAILMACPHCQSKALKKVDQYQRIIEDIPKIEEIKVKVTKYTINRYYCKKCQKIVPTFWSEVQHWKNKKEQLKFGKIVSKRSLTINQIISMPYKHFTSEQRNEIAVLLRAKLKKKKIAELLGKDRTTIWRELQRNGSENGKYYARKAKHLTKERRIKANRRFKKTRKRSLVKKSCCQKIKEILES